MSKPTIKADIRQPKQPRMIRWDTDLWDQVVARAEAEGVTASDLVRQVMAWYVSDENP